MICDTKRQTGGGDPKIPQLQNDSLKQSHCYTAVQVMTYSKGVTSPIPATLPEQTTPFYYSMLGIPLHRP
jgi:hypothetical protein